MVFDSNLVLCDGSADWSFGNLVTSDYGSPISTTRNDGGFAVLDLGAGSAAPTGVAIVLVMTEAGAAADDALTIIVEESDVEAFTSDAHELGKLDIAAATKGVILGNEAPATIVYRCNPTKQYIRIDASCVAGDDFGTVYCFVAPHPYKDL